MGIRVVVIDDNPHVAWEGRVYPVNATFQQFAGALLDLPESPVEAITSCVPLRPALEAPWTLPLDPRLGVAGTAPFDGIEGYLRHAPSIVHRNAATLRPVIREADLLWLKVPASNAPLASAIARIAGVPRFGYVAGSAAQVAAGQARRGPGAIAARLVGRSYDVLGRLASFGGERVVVGDDLAGDGIVTSLVEPDEIRLGDRPWPRTPGRLELAWAGRIVPGKGLEPLLRALADLSRRPGDERPLDVRATIIGDGPGRARLAALAASLGLEQRVTWTGYLAARGPYLEALAQKDAFVFPSPAEGFPKVVLDAMAVGLPVLATPTGQLAGLRSAAVFEPIEPEHRAIAEAIRRLATDAARATALRRAGSAFVAAHTRPVEAARLVARWQRRWPGLPWV